MSDMFSDYFAIKLCYDEEVMRPYSHSLPYYPAAEFRFPEFQTPDASRKAPTPKVISPPMQLPSAASATSRADEYCFAQADKLKEEYRRTYPDYERLIDEKFDRQTFCNPCRQQFMTDLEKPNRQRDGSCR
jgi:hypothetical protein